MNKAAARLCANYNKNRWYYICHHNDISEILLNTESNY